MNISKRRGLAVFLFVLGLGTVALGLVLLVAGVRMKMDSASAPKAINMEDYQKEKPADKWLQIGCCQLTSGYMYVRRRGGPNGQVDCLLIPIWDSRQLERAYEEDRKRADIAAGQRGRAGFDGPGRKGLHTNLVLRVDDPDILAQAGVPVVRLNPLDMTESPLDKMLRSRGYQGQAIEMLEGRLDKDQLEAPERQSLIEASEGLVTQDFKVMRKGRPWSNKESFGTLVIGLAVSLVGYKWMQSSRLGP